MRFLKRKMQMKQALNEEYDETNDSIDVKTEGSGTETVETESKPVSETEFLLPMRKPRQKPTCPNANSKNIVKNYGKTLCSFATSDIAIPYLKSLILRNKWSSIEISSFVGYIKSKKDAINSIESLRRLLVPDANEDQEITIYKKLFQEVSIIFLKYFAVNWIFGGRLTHKNAHMKYRFKMLRRVQDPEHFTYLKTTLK